MKNDSTDLPKETPEEQNKRIDAMLQHMVVEAGLHALENDEDFPSFTRKQIGDFCGCSKDTIKRIEEKALIKMKKLLLK